MEGKMTALDAAAFYAGLNLLILLGLALLVVVQRAKHKVMLGDGGVDEVHRAIRVHGNAVEYVPAGIAALVALAAAGAPVWIIHAGGIAFAVGRLAHAQGLMASSGTTPGRAIGTLLTWAAFLGLGVAGIWVGLG
jgi:uncharacterized protein